MRIHCAPYGVLFRGRNSVHRVSPNEDDGARMLAVLAYNAEPGGGVVGERAKDVLWAVGVANAHQNDITVS